jgi:hypothetical protein
MELKQTFQMYQAIDQALRNLILAAVPRVYVNSLSHDITGFDAIWLQHSNQSFHRTQNLLWIKSIITSK